MSWFSGRRERPAPPAEAAEPAAEVHDSLALKTLLDELPAGGRVRVLDLGPAVGANLEFLSRRYSCRLQVGDLYRSAAAAGRRWGDPDADPAPLLPELLPLSDEIDLVLAWDLLNYLTRKQIGALARHLGDACAPGARLLTMIATGAEMPREPLTYLLRGDGTLLYRGRGRHTRPAPRYRPAEIDELTPGFTVDRSFLLRHGIQEYLLVRS